MAAILKDETLIKKSKSTRKMKHANSILEAFYHLSQISSKSIPSISNYIPFQSWRVFETVLLCVVVSVVADYEAKCSTGVPITLTADTGYVVNHVAFNPSTLHAVCTWRIRVAPGQRIALTLYDFGRHRSHPATAATTGRGPETDSASPRSSPRVSSATVCRKYAVVREAGKKKCSPHSE